MGNRIPNVCTDRAGSSSRAPSIPSRPINPFRRAARRSATSKKASTSPSRSRHPIEGKDSAARGRWGGGAQGGAREGVQERKSAVVGKGVSGRGETGGGGNRRRNK